MNSPASLPQEWRDEWARELAAPIGEKKTGLIHTALVFRLGSEWFSVNAASAVEISKVPAIHRIPHRNAALVNVRGLAVICADLGAYLGPLGDRTTEQSRLVVLRHENWMFGTVVDAVDGVHRISAGNFSPHPPPTSADRYALDLWTLGNRSIARLDESRLFRAVKEAMA